MYLITVTTIVSICIFMAGCDSANQTHCKPPPTPPALDSNTQTTTTQAKPQAPTAQPQTSQDTTTPNTITNTNTTAPDPIHWPEISVDPANNFIDIKGFVSLNKGFLEQLVCSVGTRDHEALIVTYARPSHIHAALILLGLQPGQPGKWYLQKQSVDTNHTDQTNTDPQYQYMVDPPTGPPIAVTVRYTDDTGETVEVPIQNWVREYHTGISLPSDPYVFAGSKMARNFRDELIYVADAEGSIMGLVTFGDELLAWTRVLPDEVGIYPAEWEANTPVMPDIETPVTLRIRPIMNTSIK